MTARLHRAYREETLQTVAFAAESDRVMLATGDQLEIFSLPRGEHLRHFDDEHEGAVGPGRSWR